MTVTHSSRVTSDTVLLEFLWASDRDFSVVDKTSRHNRKWRIRWFDNFALLLEVLLKNYKIWRTMCSET